MGLLDGIVNALINTDEIEDKIESQKNIYRQYSDEYLLNKYNNDEVLFSFTKSTALSEVLKERGYNVN